MTKQERQLLYNLDSSTSYWQYRYNQAKYDEIPSYQQANQNTGDKWFILLGILGTIGFLFLLAATVI